MRCFAERGILATTTADIAAAVGVSHGTVFLHFPTREDLVIAVIDEFGRRLAAAFARDLPRDASLQGVLDAHLAALREFEPFYARLVAEAPLLPSPVRTTLFTLQNAVAFEISRAAAAEEKRGRVRRVAPHLLFNTWIALLHHYLANRELFAPGGSVIAEKGAELRRHFLHLLHPSARRHES